MAISDYGRRGRRHAGETLLGADGWRQHGRHDEEPARDTVG